MEGILFKDFILVDGRGGPLFRGDVEVEGKTITRVGNFTAKMDYQEIVEGHGRYLTPGFIDIHSHGDLMNFKRGGLKPKISQGITTEVTGQCGLGPAPISRYRREGLRRRLILQDPLNEWSWDCVSSFFHALEENGLESNFIYFLPHGLLRYEIKGDSPSPMDRGERERMVALIQESIAMGALGLSLGLSYYPAIFSSYSELRALFEVAALYHRPISIHLRSEGSGLLQSIEEVLRLAEGLNSSIHISHLKVIGEKNAYQIHQVLEILQEREMSFDHYPYTYGNLPLSVIIPPEYRRGEGLKALEDPSIRRELKEIYQRGEDSSSLTWDNLPYLLGWDRLILTHGKGGSRGYIGLSLEEIAAQVGLEPWDLSFQLLLEEDGEVLIHDLYMEEEILETILTHERGVFCTDSLFGELVHPRTLFSYPKILKEYVFKKRLLTLPTAIHKMTKRPAIILGLKDRGEILPGKRADLVTFSPQKLYNEGKEAGIHDVMINGTWKVREERYIKGTPGEILSMS